MKIALITDGINPYVLGGMQKHSYYLAKYFSKLGHKTVVFHCLNGKTPNYEQHFSKEELQDLTFVSIDFPASGKLPGHYIRNSMKYSEALFKAFINQEQSFDFIYTKGFTGMAFYQNKNQLNCPIGVQLHGLEMFQKGGNLKQWLEKKLLKKPAKYCLRKADVVFAYGGKISKIVRGLGVDDKKIIKQHGAADDFWLQNTDNQRAFDNSMAFVGRFEHRKGHHLVNQVIPNIHKDFNLIMVGNVPEDKKLKNTCIQYVGNLSAEKVFDILSKTTYLLVPSLAEGFPTIIVEAMAQGVIPIATNVGAVAEIVNLENGFLFDSNSVSELQNTIEKALSLSLNQRKQMSNEARKQVEENFNWDFSAKKLLSEIVVINDSWKRTNSESH